MGGESAGGRTDPSFSVLSFSPPPLPHSLASSRATTTPATRASTDRTMATVRAMVGGCAVEKRGVLVGCGGRWGKEGGLSRKQKSTASWGGRGSAQRSLRWLVGMQAAPPCVREEGTAAKRQGEAPPIARPGWAPGGKKEDGPPPGPPSRAPRARPSRFSTHENVVSSWRAGSGPGLLGAGGGGGGAGGAGATKRSPQFFVGGRGAPPLAPPPPLVGWMGGERQPGSCAMSTPCDSPARGTAEDGGRKKAGGALCFFYYQIFCSRPSPSLQPPRPKTPPPLSPFFLGGFFITHAHSTHTEHTRAHTQFF